jgi:hypothetical protein
MNAEKLNFYFAPIAAACVRGVLKPGSATALPPSVIGRNFTIVFAEGRSTKFGTMVGFVR